jgi:hypothetical protein
MDPIELLPIELWIMIAENIPTFYNDCIGFITTCKRFKDIFEYLGTIRILSRAIDDVGIRFFIGYKNIYLPNCRKITSNGLIPLLPYVKTLDVSMNNINYAIPYSILHSAYNLTEFYCHTTNIDIATIPTQLKKLVLSGCEINYSKLHNLTFPNLEFLDISFSKFKKMEWMDFPSMNYVNIVKLRTHINALNVLKSAKIIEAFINTLIVNKMDGKLISGIKSINFYPQKKIYKIKTNIVIDEFYMKVEHISGYLDKYTNLEKVKCKI